MEIGLKTIGPTIGCKCWFRERLTLGDRWVLQLRKTWGTSETFMQSLSRFIHSPSAGLLTISAFSLLLMVLFQAFGMSAIANASSSRDEFPGRRQGGGTHWVTPAPSPLAQF